MFTGFVEHAVALLADVAPIYPVGAEADLIQSSHPLMVLAEPSTLALAIIGVGVLAVSHRVRRAKRRYTHSSQARYAKQSVSHVSEPPKRGAA